MSFRSLSWCICLLGAIAFGCDDNPSSDGGPGSDAGPTSDGSPPGGDGNDSFATAEGLTGGVAMGAISPAADLDYYTISGTEGDWIIIRTDANPDNDPMMIDTVVTLYDSSMNMMAENDDAQPRFGVDSEIITRLPATGDYFVLVQEWSSWVAGETPEGGSSFRYELTVSGLNITSAAVTVDEETGDLPANAQTLNVDVGAGADFGVLVGTLRDGSDVDRYSFTGSATRPRMQVTLMPPGTAGYGSTVTPTRVWISSMDGSEVIAEIDPGAFISGMASPQLQPTLPATPFLLNVDHGGSAGANDFYVFKVFGLADNPAEMMEATNGVATPLTPEPLSLMPDMMNATLRRAFVLADLPVGDTDHYSIEVAAGENVGVFCGSASLGSGVMGLTATLLDATGADLSPAVSAMENPIEGLSISNQAVPSAGTYIVRLTRGPTQGSPTATFVRCGFTAAPPTP